MATYHVTKPALWALVKPREGGATFLPAPTAGLAWIDAVGEEPSLEGLSQPRAAQSPKGFFLPASESVGRYGQQASTAAAVQTQTVTLVGVRACELRARKYLDQVMLAGAFEAPDYRQRQDAMTVVSCDCLDCAESCFCTLVGGQPFATEGFDANLTPLADGYVAEVATDRGQRWLDQIGSRQAGPEHLAERDEIRRNMTERVRRQNERFTFVADDRAQPALPNDDDDAWRQFAADCVECGACTHICPTCHCFYLYDQVLGPEAFERVRTWDSCLLSSYHRMAGGEHMKLTPRPRLLSRLANRVLHKFTYSPQQYELLGCVGCGRCVDACLGAIDIRQVVQSLGAGGREQGQ